MVEEGGGAVAQILAYNKQIAKAFKIPFLYLNSCFEGMLTCLYLIFNCLICNQGDYAGHQGRRSQPDNAGIEGPPRM